MAKQAKSRLGLTIDHVLIAVRDLKDTADVFNNLGFTVTPEGLHPGRGSRNRLVVFENDYLELISITDPTLPLFRPNMAVFLESRQGVFIFSMGTSDVQKVFLETKSRGLKINEPIYGARHSAGGDMEYSWHQSEIEPDEFPGSQTFFIQHDHSIKQRYKNPPNAWNHKNGSLGIYNLTLVVDDAMESARQWASILNLEISYRGVLDLLSAKRVSLAFDNCTLDFLSPTGQGVIQDFLTEFGSGPYSMAIKVKDLKKVQELLESRDVPLTYITLDGLSGILISADNAQGVRLTLV
jgi:hypothetical protein